MDTQWKLLREASIEYLKHMFSWGKIRNIKKKTTEKGVLSIVLSISSVAKALIRLCVCTRRHAPLFFACNKIRGSRGEALTRSSHIVDGAYQLW